MAKRKQSDIADFKSVIQLALLPEHEDKLVALEYSPEDVIESLEILLSTGYSVEFTHDPAQGSYSMCIKGRDPTATNAGMWLYGNGDSLEKCIKSALFKHFVIAEQQKWEDFGGERPVRAYW